MMKRNLSKFLLAGACTLVFSAPALAGSIGEPGDNGQYVQFDVPNADFTEATAINKHGTVAGFWEDPATSYIHGFIRSTDGTITPFDPPGSELTEPLGMNEKGAVVGEYEDQSFRSYGFLRKPNGDLDTFSGEGIRGARDINAQGDICGYLDDGQGFVRPANGTAMEIHLPGAVSSRANGINDTGTVAGTFTDDAGVSHGFSRTADGTVTTFDVPGSVSTGGSRISNDGTILGGYTNAAGKRRVYLRAASGEFTDFSVSRNTTEITSLRLNRKGTVVGSFRSPKTNHYVAFQRKPGGALLRLKPPGVLWDTAGGINDNGVIAGAFVTSDGIGHGYLRLP